MTQPDEKTRPNRYAPPGAAVADIVPPWQPIPPGVRNACWLILGALVLGLISLLPEIRVPAPLAGMIDAVCIVMEMAACWKLFLGADAKWFGRRTVAGPGNPP